MITNAAMLSACGQGVHGQMQLAAILIAMTNYSKLKAQRNTTPLLQHNLGVLLLLGILLNTPIDSRFEIRVFGMAHHLLYAIQKTKKIYFLMKNHR